MPHKTNFENLFHDADGSPIVLSYNTQVSEFPIHWHNYVEVMYVIDGQITVEISNCSYHLNSNEILFIWPGELHTILPNTQPLTAILQFDIRLMTQLPSFKKCYTLIPKVRLISEYSNPSIFHSLADCILQIHQYRSQEEEAEKKHLIPDPFTDAKMCISLYNFLIHTCSFEMNLLNAHNTKNASISERTMQRIVAACSYISSNCTENISLDSAAAYAGFSKYHFSRLFKEYIGISYTEYLSDCRINYAKTLLADPKSNISDIAMQTGFGSIASFNRVFRKQEGCTPSEFRTLLISSDS